MFRALSLSQLGLAATQAESIELALSHGFRGIDLDLLEFHERAQSHGLSHARRLIDSAKLKLGTFDLPFDPSADDGEFAAGLARLKPLAETAAAVGCGRAVTTVSPVSRSRPYHENFEFHRRRYNEVATVLAPFNIRLGIGFSAAASADHQGFEFIRTLDALTLLTGTIASRNVGLVIDLWQLWRSGGNVEDLRKLNAQQLVAVRVADAPADQDREQAGEDSRLPPSETGTIDLAQSLRLLAELGYDGPITPNPSRESFGNLSRESIVRTVAAGLDKAWKAAGLTPAGKLTVSAKK